VGVLPGNPTEKRAKSMSRTTIGVKRELYCYYLLSGMTSEAAYEAVGYKGNRHNAWAFHNHVDTQERLTALLEDLQRSTLERRPGAWSDDEMDMFLQGSAIEARQGGDYSPAIRAVELLGRDRGKFGVTPDPQAQLPEHTDQSDEETARHTIRWLNEMKEKLNVNSIDELTAVLQTRIGEVDEDVASDTQSDTREQTGG